ncbi:MAG: hypothetical protein ACM31C_30575 [Acidobacteriota bacterium]
MLGLAFATPGGGGEIGTFADSAMLARGGMPAGFSPSGGMMLGDHDGMAYRYAMYCKDATGAVLAACGAATASADVVAEWSGVQHATACDATFDRHGAWTLTDLASASAGLSGSSALTEDATFRTSNGMMMSSYHLAAHEDLALQLDMATLAVAGGLSHVSLDVVHDERDMHGTDRESYAMHAHVMFSTGACTLTLDDSHAYAIDLATGAATRAPIR